MASIFTKIINGEIPAYKIYEDEYSVAFLSINPLKRGHTLVVPKLEVDKWTNLPEDEFQKLMLASKYVAQIIEAKIPCERIGVIVSGFEIPHAHIHLIPADSEVDFDFSHARPASKEELEEVHILLTGHGH